MKTRQEREFERVSGAEEGTVGGRFVSNVWTARSGAEIEAVSVEWALGKEAGEVCAVGPTAQASGGKRRARGGRSRKGAGWCEATGEGRCEGLELIAGEEAIDVGSEEEWLREVPTSHPARMLSCRVDAFYLDFKGALLPEVRAELMTRLEDAKKSGVGVRLLWGDFQGVLGAHGHEGWWNLETAEGAVLIREGGQGGWTVHTKPRAMFLHTRSPRAALEWSRSVVRTLCGEVKEEKVGRLDLCADFVRFGLSEVDLKAFVGKKTKATAIAQIREFAKEGIRTGFMVGTGDFATVIYDKTEELRLPRNDGGDKRSLEEATWKMSGWDGTEQVTRVEVRFRGGAFKEMKMHEPEEVLRKIDACWSYMTKKWLRLVQLETATRRERCKLDPLWARVQNVVFRERQAPILREREVGQTEPCRALRTMFNAAASDGALHPIPCRRGEEYAARMSEERAEAWVQTEFRFHCGAHHGARFATKILSRCAPRDAVALIVEIRNSVCARKGIRAVEPDRMAA